jgi:8-oxo-dGTP pyrophosphatase MutT (NUDIX family)
MKNTIYEIIQGIKPSDSLEEEDIYETLSWIKSGEAIFRIQKPDIPAKHICSYFVVLDQEYSKILLVDHKYAGLWLPPGGHVEIDEDPKETVTRESFEELSIKAEFFYENPIFLTSTLTVGATSGHTDVSLWYVIQGDHKTLYNFDQNEFNGLQWFDFDKLPYEKTEPHLPRFMAKLQGMLEQQ